MSTVKQNECIKAAASALRAASCAVRNACTESALAGVGTFEIVREFDQLKRLRSQLSNLVVKFDNLADAANDAVPAAACPNCGGWTACGGMSQHRDSLVPQIGRVGCVCNNSSGFRERIAARLEHDSFAAQLRPRHFEQLCRALA